MFTIGKTVLILDSVKLADFMHVLQGLERLLLVDRGPSDGDWGDHCKMFLCPPGRAIVWSLKVNTKLEIKVHRASRYGGSRIRCNEGGCSKALKRICCNGEHF